MFGENRRARSYLLIQSPGENIYTSGADSVVHEVHYSAKRNIEALVRSFGGKRTYQIGSPELHLGIQLNHDEQSLNMLTEDGNHIVLCGGSLVACLKSTYLEIAGWAFYRTSIENRNSSIVFDLPLDACWDCFSLEDPDRLSKRIADGYAREVILAARYKEGTVVGRPAFDVKLNGEIIKEVYPAHPFLRPKEKSELFDAWTDNFSRISRGNSRDRLEPLGESVLSLALNLFSKTQDLLYNRKREKTP